MQNEAPKAQRLYILGDLFEYWIGDDDDNPFNKEISSVIRAVSEQIPVFFIHGNRDFAIGKKFAHACNMTLLTEQTVIDLYGQKALISHGDELCTRDIEYMRFRKKARGWWWPKLMLSLPLRWRKKIAENGRKASAGNKRQLTSDIMDVTKHEVDKAMKRNNVKLFIHGHTHRPNIHEFMLDNQQAKRIVLGDWYTQGSVLIANENSLELAHRPFN